MSFREVELLNKRATELIIRISKLYSKEKYNYEVVSHKIRDNFVAMVENNYGVRDNREKKFKIDYPNCSLNAFEAAATKLVQESENYRNYGKSDDQIYLNNLLSFRALLFGFFSAYQSVINGQKVGWLNNEVTMEIEACFKIRIASIYRSPNIHQSQIKDILNPLKLVYEKWGLNEQTKKEIHSFEEQIRRGKTCDFAQLF